MNYAVVLAGGVGSRLGANIPKQYIKVNDKPIIVYTLEKFQQSPDTDAIAVVCAEQWEPYVRELCEQYGITKVKWFFRGGNSCQASIMSSVFGLRDQIKPEDNLMIHMSVSPMIDLENIKNGFKTCSEKGNAFATRPCLLNMCIKMDDDNDEWSTKNIFKHQVLQLNMPWVVRYDEMYALYKEGYEKGIAMGENDYLTTLMFSFGKKVYFYPDNEQNSLKVTTKEDLDLLRAYLWLEEQKKAEAEEA